MKGEHKSEKPLSNFQKPMTTIYTTTLVEAEETISWTHECLNVVNAGESNMATSANMYEVPTPFFPCTGTPER